MESFIGGKDFPGEGFSDANYNSSHEKVKILEGAQFYPGYGLNQQGTQMYLKNAAKEEFLLYDIK